VPGVLSHWQAANTVDRRRTASACLKTCMFPEPCMNGARRTDRRAPCAPGS
jgi:hypothetical protein